MFQLLDLFSGIGGFSLGLERSGGFKTVAFCEIEPFCRKVLKKHWPDVPCYEDVRELTAAKLRADGIVPDAICGGFPCQDISVAGKGAGIEGERSGLWSEYARIIGELRPRIVIVENVAALLGRGIERVCGDLACLGYDSEWHVISAADVGAPHLRRRVWIVAGLVADADDQGEPQPSGSIGHERGWIGNGGQSIALADANGSRLPPTRPQQIGTYWFDAGGVPASSDWWGTEPDVGRVAHGVPARMDRLRSLGNAVVPQIPEIIGWAILESMQ